MGEFGIREKPAPAPVFGGVRPKVGYFPVELPSRHSRVHELRVRHCAAANAGLEAQEELGTWLDAECTELLASIDGLAGFVPKFPPLCGLSGIARFLQRVLSRPPRSVCPGPTSTFTGWPLTTIVISKRSSFIFCLPF